MMYALKSRVHHVITRSKTNNEHYLTYNLVFETLVDFLFVVGELLHDHRLSIQSQCAIFIEFFLLVPKRWGNRILNAKETGKIVTQVKILSIEAHVAHAHMNETHLELIQKPSQLFASVVNVFQYFSFLVFKIHVHIWYSLIQSLQSVIRLFFSFFQCLVELDIQIWQLVFKPLVSNRITCIIKLC